MNLPKIAGLSFKTTCEENQMIEAIADRSLQCDPELDRMDLIMDLTAAHCNGCELDLKRMLNEFNDFNLSHDIYGISAHLNRRTGQLEDHFLPRGAK